LKSLIDVDDLVFDESWYLTSRKAHEIIQLSHLGLTYTVYKATLTQDIFFSNKIPRKLLELLPPIANRKFVISDKSYHRTQQYFNRNIYYRGFWQDPEIAKYLMRSKIRSATYDIHDADISNIIKILRNSDSIAVHIRRGDYLSNTNWGKLTHAVLPTEYYRNGMNKFARKFSNPLFVVFSDDVDWVRQSDIFLSNNCLLIDPAEYGAVMSFQFMLECKSYLIANSSFSWWAAFLNRSLAQYIVAPKTYHLAQSFASLPNALLI
jgi:hypothetical protein